MSEKLLSIVVPTKNRVEYLKSFIRLVKNIGDGRIELVVQDNSDDNSEVLAFIEENNFDGLVYCYDNSEMSVVDNCDLSIKNSSGKYVCFMGDDDLVSSRLVEFVEFMDRYGYESAVFKPSQYYWPKVQFKAHKFPNLIVKKFAPKVRELDVDATFDRLLKTGATALDLMPKVYHGVMLRERLEDVYRVAGTYFPGPSPDMANAVALAHFVKKHIYCALPLVTAGASPKSAAGLGAKHQHVGKVGEISFLPKDTEKLWNINVPKVWTGPTVYAQSLYLSLVALNDVESIEKFNYNYHYGFFKVFCGEHAGLLRDIKKVNKKYNSFLVECYRFKVFLERAYVFVKNKLMLATKCGAGLHDGVLDSSAAAQIVDEAIKDIDLSGMFDKLRKKTK